MKNYIISIFLVLLLQSVKSDLPIHCKQNQIEGKWNLYTSDTLLNGDGQLSCGHTQPDNQKTSYLAMPDFNKTNQITVNLQANDVVRGVKESSKTGTWTMIYDEGFEIDFDNTKFFSFNKYISKGSDYESDCYNTLVGWYHNYATQERGCYQAEKVDQSGTTSNVHQDKVVQPPSLLQVNEKDFIPTPDTYIPQDGDLHMHKDSKEHNKIVNRLNLVEKKTWKAKSHNEFKDLTIGDLNNKAGRRKTYSFAQTRTEKQNADRWASYSSQSLSDLPKSLNWADKIQGPTQQKDCGSCYAISTMEMLQSRIRIKYDDPIKLSVQDSIDCNYYNQGCDGGYGFLVSKYYTENSLVTEQCYPYTSVDGQCGDKANSCHQNQKNKYKVENYRYLGGSYGKTTEREMMEEIQKNGPIVVSFEPGMDFMYYEEGIYHSVDAAQWILSHEQAPEWQQVDHSVMCYGWGENDDGKYWILMNSWGQQWGESGSFRMRRGTDESNIESMGEAAEVIKVNSSSFIEINNENKRNNLKKNNK